ncbi:hypothetical protein D7V88_42130, partial [Corallococcus terminator]
MQYLDPTDGSSPVSLSAAQSLSTLIPNYKTGDALTAPVTLYTTLADTAALAFARGKNSTHAASTLTAALAVTDRLFEKHVAGTAPWNLRTTLHVTLTQPPSQTLRGVVFAALADVALNQQARRIALSAGLTPVQGFDALKLLALLQRDIADGRFDGYEGGILLRVLGSPAYEFTANELR